MNHGAFLADEKTCGGREGRGRGGREAGETGGEKLGGGEKRGTVVSGTCLSKGLSTREAGRGHATPHMPVETA